MIDSGTTLARAYNGLQRAHSPGGTHRQLERGKGGGCTLTLPPEVLPRVLAH